MDQIWAPWRIQYVLAKKSTRCIFCAMASQRDGEGRESNDEENHVLFRSKASFAVLNAFPYNPGHIMVAPYQHTGDLVELSADVRAELLEGLVRCQEALKKAYNPGGFNYGLNVGASAGAGFADHLHFHIVPRWPGDTNFMPILADTRVLPEGMREVYLKLREVLA